MHSCTSFIRGQYQQKDVQFQEKRRQYQQIDGQYYPLRGQCQSYKRLIPPDKKWAQTIERSKLK